MSFVSSASYGESGQVLISNGKSPEWADPANLADIAFSQRILTIPYGVSNFPLTSAPQPFVTNVVIQTAGNKTGVWEGGKISYYLSSSTTPEFNLDIYFENTNVGTTLYATVYLLYKNG